MEFTKLDNNIEDCNAVAKAVIPSDTTFIRKLKTENVDDNDFKTNFELEKRPPYFSTSGWKDCKEFSMYNGVSINSYEESVQEEVLKIYKVKFNVSPNYKKSACVFRVKQDNGLVESTPNGNDKHHNTLYKVDSFSISESIEIVEVIDLSEKCS